MTLRPGLLITPPEVEEDPLYQIDPGWYRQMGRDLDTVVRERRCYLCRRQLEEVPLGTVTLEEHTRAVLECCARREGYITPETPVLEAVFRVLLAAENRPISLTRIYQALHDWWGGYQTPRVVDLRALRRMLERDSAYGIRRVGRLARQEGQG